MANVRIWNKKKKKKKKKDVKRCKKIAKKIGMKRFVLRRDRFKYSLKMVKQVQFFSKIELRQ